MSTEPAPARRQIPLWLAAAATAVAGVVLLVLPGHRPSPLANPSGLALPAQGKTATIPPPVSVTSSTVAPRPAGSTSLAAAGADVELPPSGAQRQWRSVAAGFSRDFASRGVGHGDWLHRVSRWTTPQLAQQYRHVDPARIPAAKLVRLEPVAVGAHVVDVTATYDTGLTLAVRLELSPTGWRVAGAQPRRR